MKHSLKYLAILALVFSARAAFGQTGFSETVTSHTPYGNNSGNDFWFAPIQNYIDQPGKYIRIYISSLVQTQAFVQLGDSMVAVTVNVPAYAGKDSVNYAVFNVPLSWEINSSCIVENKGIHVWSPSANLSVYLMSHNPYTSDGFYCIPSQDLGTDYVVAAYEALFEGFGSYVYDEPSEFTVTAIQDSTKIQITPSIDCRVSGEYPSGATTIGAQQGKVTTFTLNRGQAIQFQTVEATDADNFDLTGTVIHSNNPVGVVGGSVCPNIPPDFPFCDFICDMIIPVQSWGETYYVTNSVQPIGEPNKDLNLYLLITSVPNQTIFRSNCSQGLVTEAVLGPKYDHIYLEEEGTNEWYSDQPFLLVQYLNSSTYPDGVNGNGDPAEVGINPVESFSKTVLFQTAPSASIQSPYDNYANVTVNSNDTANVKFDGQHITSYSNQPLCGRSNDESGSFAIYTIPHVTPGAHLVESDSGVGVSVYGYGFDESYAWAGALGKRFLTDTTVKDSVPPAITFVNDSLCLHILLSDTATGLSGIFTDSISNLTFTFDTSFVSGALYTTANLCVIDPLQTGYMQLQVTDLAGNKSIATIIYTHPPIVSAPGFTLTSASFDTVLVGTEKTLPILVVTDTSTQYPITIDKIWIDASEFIFNPNVSGNHLPITLSPLESRRFVITFNPGRDSAYACLANASSSELPTVHVDTLRGIGYSFPAGVSQGSQSKFYATLTPNPAANSVQLNFSLSQTADVSLELSSMDGKTVFRWNANAESDGEHAETLDLSSLAQGSYIYSFKANGQTLSGKLIINR